MIKKLERNSTNMSIASFHEQNQSGKFNYNPPYQRQSVWTDEKQSYFIDSILRNFPIPPIFLHRKIDDNTGRTSFDVIDGKQRLTAIARFIENEIPAANEYGTGDADSPIDGKYFSDLSSDHTLSEFKSYFWKYDLPIEFIDPTDNGLIEEVFDRLNRNGEPLNGQELRNAQFHSSEILKAVDILHEDEYMKERLWVTDLARMEDREFCSECLFSAHQKQVIGSSQKILDDLYANFSDADFTQSMGLAKSICADLGNLDLDYDGWRINGVSHLYGLWGAALVLKINGESISDYSKPLIDFYKSLRDRNATPDPNREEYKKSMNSRTKERFMRVKRVKALLSACGAGNLPVP